MSDKLYDSKYLKQLEAVLEKTVNRSLEILQPCKNDCIADIGCGIGSLSFLLAKSEAAVYGIDSDEQFLKIARANNTGANRIHFINTTASNINLPDNTFTKIVFHRVFQHLPNYQPVLQECFRLLKPQGIIHLVEPDYLSYTFFSANQQFERKLMDAIAYSRFPNSNKVRTLPQQLRENGFAVKNIEVNSYVFKSFAAANRLVNFDDSFQRGIKAGNFTDEDEAAWNKIKQQPDITFNFLVNLLLITAQKTE